VGDFLFNTSLILDAAKNAFSSKCDILITPELSLTGYPPEDLLFNAAFIKSSNQALNNLAKNLAIYKDLFVLVGHPVCDGEKVKNCISIISNGKAVFIYEKQILPNKGVFDELRYFTPGINSNLFEIRNIKIAFLICEDIWSNVPSVTAHTLGAHLIISVNASPYYLDKQTERLNIVKEKTLSLKIPIIYLNAVGGQDELVFDGNSFAFNKTGELIASFPQFDSHQDIINFGGDDLKVSKIHPQLSQEAEIFNALVLGTRDYVKKNNFPGIIIGLSGGIDSALVLAIAVKAIGKDKVKAVMMPSIYTSKLSLLDAKKISKNFGVDFSVIPIKSSVKKIEHALRRELSVNNCGIAEENIQARIRGIFLMAISNKTGNLVLTTGNKSEMAVGYCTLYGDMAGGFAVIKDIYKGFVYRLSEYVNKDKCLIPTSVIERPPSAELKPNQIDQESLPPYEILDQILYKFLELNQSSVEIIQSGYSDFEVKKIISMVVKSEYKRRQSPVGIKISKKAFGKDWRYPITSRFSNY